MTKWKMEHQDFVNSWVKWWTFCGNLVQVISTFFKVFFPTERPKRKSQAKSLVNARLFTLGKRKYIQKSVQAKKLVKFHGIFYLLIEIYLNNYVRLENINLTEFFWWLWSNRYIYISISTEICIQNVENLEQNLLFFSLPFV